MTDPDGVPYDTTSIDVPIDTKIGNFGAMVAEIWSPFVPNGGATVFPSGGGNLKACPIPNRLSSYDGKSGTKEAPFHINLKQKPAIGAAPAPAPVDQLQELREKVAGTDVSDCRLPSDLFDRDKKLQPYVTAAEVCARDGATRRLLSQLGNYTQGELQEFSCIIAPSGTGKSQLSATAAKTDEWNVVYFYTGTSGADDPNIQRYYYPHVPVRDILLECVQGYRTKLFRDRGAFSISKNNSAHPLFQLLHRCFFPDDSETVDTAPKLRERIAMESSRGGGKTLLVFLDEVPSSESSNDQFEEVMLLRNVLRAVGVKPILMSTHTGSINAVKKGTDSRGPEEARFWCHVYVDLPQYQSDPSSKGANPWRVPTERPLISAWMEEDKENDLSRVVKNMHSKLQQAKGQAWLHNPALQLCQLFRTKASAVVPDCYKHRIVGYHFGRIQAAGASPWVVNRDQAADWIQERTVQFVEPEVEPILFLALATWKWADITGVPASTAKLYFPLMSNKRRKVSTPVAASIREVFEERSSYFTKGIDTDNDEAKKLDGDDLEVLALASVTLASLQSDDGVFASIPVSTFLANVFHFMSDLPLDKDKMIATATEIKRILEEEESIEDIAKIRVPTCPSAGSSFLKVPWDDPFKPNASEIGQIDRPPDSERRGGSVKCEGETVLHVECKNLAGGLISTVLDKVVKRMRNNCKLSLLFTSNINGLFTEDGAYEQAVAQMGVKPHEVCYLMLDHQKESPYWLKVNKGKLTLKPEKDTEFLMVVIATSAVKAARMNL